MPWIKRCGTGGFLWELPGESGAGEQNFACGIFPVPAAGNGSRGREADGSYGRILGIGCRAGGNLFWNGSGSDLVAVPSAA